LGRSLKELFAELKKKKREKQRLEESGDTRKPNVERRIYGAYYRKVRFSTITQVC